MTIRPARPEDLLEIMRLVRELADYEKAADQVAATPTHFADALFPTDRAPAAFCHVAEAGEGGERRVVGMALWFLSFSTWTGTHGIWLEDLYVEPGHRGSGLGRSLLATLAEVCVERGYQRLEWWVLDWNAPSIAFYEALGAAAQEDWTTYRLDGAVLTALARQGGA